MKKTFILIVLASGALIAGARMAFAQGVITINPALPGISNISSTGPCGWVVDFYNFALLFAGILAFGAIVYGGFLYATSAGNAHKQGEGREWIWSALIGILLLAGAYLILYTINPNLTKCSLPTLSNVAVSGGGTTSGGGTSGGGTSNGGSTSGGTSNGCSGSQCQLLSADGFTCKPASQQPGGVASCDAAANMVATLQCMQNAGAPPFTITEAMPPTVKHGSACHNDGCCVDMTVNAGSCAAVQQLVNAATTCHATQIYNEYSACGGQTFGTTKASNVHVQGQNCN